MLGRGPLEGGQELPGLHQGIGAGVGGQQALFHVDVFQEILEEIAFVNGGFPLRYFLRGTPSSLTSLKYFRFPAISPR